MSKENKHLYKEYRGMLMSSMFLAMQTAIKHNEMKKELERQKKQRIAKQQQKLLNKKEWDINIISKGGVTFWEQKVVDEDTGKTKIKHVKITVIPQGQETTEFSNKGKFSFRDGLGNRIYISVRTYADAEQFITEWYGVKKYTLSCSAI